MLTGVELRLPEPKPWSEPSSIQPVLPQLRIWLGSPPMNCTALKKSAGICGLPLNLSRPLSRPSGVFSMPIILVNAMPPIGVSIMSTKGLKGETMPDSRSAMGSRKSLTKLPTSIARLVRSTLGALSFWPYCQSQSMIRLARSLGMALMLPATARVVCSLMSVLTLKTVPKVWLGDCENNCARPRRPLLSPRTSTPSRTSAPLALKAWPAACRPMSTTVAVKKSSLPSAVKGWPFWPLR